MIFLLALSLLHFSALGETTSGIFERINRCEASRVLKNQKCPSTSQLNSQIALVCADPVKYACSHSPPRGELLNSKCQINLNETRAASQTPEVKKMTAQILNSENSFLKSHESECPARGPNCEISLRIKYIEALKGLQLAAAYTPDRLLRLNLLFDEVKATAIKMAAESKKLSSSEKALIISRIKNTEILDPNMNDPNPCSYLGAEGADTGIFNYSSTNKNQVSTVNFCMGAMAMMDRESEASLILTLSHELSHSFDPCMLDSLADVNQNEFNGDKVFNSINQCLRGGSGPRGCTASKLHCNDPKNSRAFCERETLAKSGRMYENCMQMTLRRPNCPWSADTDGAMDLASYRKGPGPVDQTRESFSDFIGAQVYGRMLKNRGNTRVLDPQEKLDFLISIGADFASLHGICLSENTNDSHPPGRMRVNGTILVNDELSAQLCPGSKTAKCEGL